jgi:regulator of protease activity HflC (stomatin/prohibitin superfamily)
MKNKIILLCSLAFMALSLTSCTNWNRVEPNHEGVLMQNYGRSGKGDFKIVTGGQGILGPGTELYQVPMWEVGGNADSISVNTKDATYFTVDPTYTYTATPGRGVDIIFAYKHYGSEDKEGFFNNIEANILNRIVTDSYREAARNFSSDSLVSHMNTYERIVEDTLRARFARQCFTFKSVTSGLKPPKSMVDAINLKNNSKQRALAVINDIQVSKLKLEQAKIDAQTDIESSRGLTPEILKLRGIEAMEKLAKSSNAKTVLINGNNPFILQ